MQAADNDNVLAELEADTMMGRMPSVEEAGPTSMAKAINLTAGAVAD